MRSIVYAVILSALSPNIASAQCFFYDSPIDATRPLPPVNDPFKVCKVEAILHSRFHHPACTTERIPGTPKNASGLTTYVNCYSLRYDPPRCVGTYYREDNQCITGNSYPARIGLCSLPCSEGEGARRVFINGIAESLKDGAPSDYPFLTARDLPEGQAILSLYAQLDRVHQRVVAEGGEHLPVKLAALDLADLSLHIADSAYANGENDTGNEYLQKARILVDAVLSFAPGISLVKDGVTLMTGVNPITGDEVSNVERAVIAGAILAPAVIGGTIKVAKAARALDKVAHAGGTAAAKHADELIGVIKHSDEAVEAFSKAVGPTHLIQATEEVGKATDELVNAFVITAAEARAAETSPNLVYRALRADEAAALARGEGLMAKNVEGGWTAAEHVVRGSSPASFANDPWISTSRSLKVARAFDSGNGVAVIDISRVSSTQVEVWKTAPRVGGAAGLPYQYSIWQREITIHQSIPVDAITGVLR